MQEEEQGKEVEEPSEKKQASVVANWLKEVAEARKREKDWRSSAQKLVEMYESKSPQTTPFNILYSNTETLAPALYNNVPRPVVSRRFKDEAPLQKISADVAKRTLMYLLDNDADDTLDFDSAMMQCVLGALVPGRGMLRFRYSPVFVSTTDEDGVVRETVASESITCENVAWDRVLFGYASTWKEVPWQCFEHFLTREECEKQFGEELGRALPFDIIPSEIADSPTEGKSNIKDAQGASLVHILEIWDKEKREVLFIAPGHPHKILESAPDPLKLSGFFPNPCPLMLYAKLSSLVPQTLYAAYEEQARELNRLTVRLKHLVNMLRVRGMYDVEIEGIEKVLNAEDGEMIPIENLAKLSAGGGQARLDTAFWLAPLDETVRTIQQLMIERENCKRVIYEITGISDILRGASAASETLGAQEIKQAWGTLRLKRMQKLVGKYARDCLRVMAEIAFKHLNQQTIAGMTGLNFPTQEQKAQAQQFLVQYQPPPAPPPQPGQPPTPPVPPPPQVLEAQKIAALPSWEEILAPLSDTLLRTYNITIETNSTVDAEATEDKQNIGELLNAIAQFFNGVGPMVEQGMLPFDVTKSMLLAVVRRYRFGDEVENELKAMKAPEPAGPPPAEQMKLEALKLENSNAQAIGEMKLRQMEMEMEKTAAAHKMEMEAIQQRSEQQLLAHRIKLAELAQKETKPAPNRQS